MAQLLQFGLFIGKVKVFGRSDEKFSILQNNTSIKAGDRFLVKADPVDLKLMMDEYSIRLTKKMRQRIDKLKDDNTIWEKEPLEKVTQLKEINAFRHEGFWQCVDTKRDKDNLNNLLDKGKIPWL